ncbi:Gfo/Idh/MocA family oxidoreductase [Clostridium sp. AL.422]|uniref:Gfo/Idh/MocA family protein n=1 Tax=Clostridium TaxID=1485 RepID=UPI00293DB58A|nr:MULTISPECIES: Gfo/Idh/MocA family oxidoreductase [unclassified Clostridium]MDV4150907.1 Gfo/Idh/MocA family oxidoreductase [Clostridium sp. AL.422]
MIRWGIIAPGGIANAFANEVIKTEDGILSAVYGRNEEKTKEFAKKHNIEKYYVNIDEFLNDDNIDAVYIATPHNYHMEYAKKCVLAKKHVLCEKSFSYDAKTGIEVIEIAKENNVFIMEALWTLFLPAVNQAKKWIEEGRIGKVKLITVNFGFKSDYNPISRLYDPNLAGGALLDVGIYPILFSNYVANAYPKEISASAEFTNTNVDESDIINLKYEDGTLASLTCSIGVDIDKSAVIFGENGKIVVPRFWMAKEAYLYNGDVSEEFIDKYEEAGYKYEIEEVNKCIINGDLESSVASHSFTIGLAKIMDEVRSQIGLVYPFEEN